MTATVSTVDRVLDWAGPLELPVGDELGVQAACGIMQVHGRRFGRPTPLPIDYASTLARVLADTGVRAARVARLRGLPLRRVRTSVAQAALLAVGQYLAAATAPDDWREPQEPGGGPFTSADGVRFELETLNPEQWQRFWSSLAADDAAVRAGWRPFQHRFATATCPLPAELYDVAARVDLTVLTLAADRAGVTLMPLRTERTTLPPWRVRATVSTVDGLSAARELPLDGLLVVDAGNRVQGPLAAHLLRLLGAEVVRVEPPGGDPMRGVPPMAGACSARFTALNRGKGAVELDLGTPPGRDGLRDLVARADVFLHNWKPGKAAERRLDAADLAAVRPGLVYAAASGWGDALGPEAPVGTDFVVQAYSGLAAALAVPAAPSLLTLTDVLGGVVCAQGILAALADRIRTGAGQRVDSSLLSATSVLPAARRAAVTGGGLVAGTPPVPVCTELASLAEDRRFDPVLERPPDLGGCAVARSPWRFER